MDSVVKFVATLGFIGYLPIAPGTFGTIIGLLVIIILKPSVYLHVTLTLIMIPVGIITSHRAEMLLQENDSRRIVIDEFCGYLLSVLFIPFSYGAALTAFFLFRLFDILKPFPIRTLESSLNGGIGIMADDMLAGIYTNIILQILLAREPDFFSFI